jgi:hypothetical protein
MYTLAIPNSLKKRTLGFLKQNWINFDEHSSVGGFFDISFPDLDEGGFRDISLKLKQQGVTLIGADTQLTEKKIMKLADLINEQDLGKKVYPLGNDDGPSQGFKSNDAEEILVDLKNMLKSWETKTYDSPEERYKEYYLDIEDLVKDYEMGMTHDYEDKEDDEAERAFSVDAPDRYNESVRKTIRKEIKRIFQ